MGASPSKNIEDFDAGTLDLKDSSLKFVKPEIKTGMKPSNLKSDYKVTKKQIKIR